MAPYTAHAELLDDGVVQVQLKWHHQFQFAGYYAALHKGFYARAGLDVELIEGQAGLDFVEEVTSGRADFGIEMPDLALRRAAGEPVVVMACIFQHSPLTLVSLAESGIRTPHDLVGRKVMLRPKSNADLRAMFVQEGIELGDIQLLEHSFDVEDLVSGRVDAMSLYSTAYVAQLESRGLHLSMLRPEQYGVDFYGDCLFSTEATIASDPERAERFLKATLEGWEYAMQNPREVATLIHEHYTPEIPVAMLEREAELMAPLLMHDVVRIGHVNPGRWTHIAGVFASQGMLDASVSLDGFIYAPRVERPTLPLEPDLTWLYVILGGGAAVAAFAWIWVFSLRKLVRERTRELTAINHKHRRLADNLIGAFLFRREPDGRFSYVSSSVDGVLGISPEAFCRHYSELLTDNPANDVARAALEASARGERQPSFELEVHRRDGEKNGERRWLEISEVPVLDEERRLLAVEGVAHDFSERRRLEERLRHAQKMEAVGQLAGGVAHDFNNLLQAILGFAGLLELSNKDAESQGFLQQIVLAAERAATLTGQLLAFSRRQVLSVDRFDLAGSLASIAEMVRRVIGEHITLELHRCLEATLVQADRGLLEQVLLNLCLNARDAMPAGGVIRVEVSRHHFDSSAPTPQTATHPGDWIRLRVADDGEGMDEATLGRAFEPFFTTKKLGKGTGLGLASVYGTVQQHGGFVELSSTLGQGTTVDVYLPESVGDVGTTAPRPHDPLGGSETILLAEDDDGVRDVARVILELAGYHVLVHADGEEAISGFDAHSDEIDMALLDVVMPKCGGRAVYDHIKATRPEVPVLFASGYGASELGTHFVLDVGMQLIQKPYKRDELLDRVRSMLDGARAVHHSADA